ncbi:MAG: hypothetical protein Q8K18_04410 [Burkholderiales bacterium]|nr:hypothetical protein [Burkholderiales bacterium]
MTQPTLRQTFENAARSVTESFQRAGPFPGQEVTPPLLIEAIAQCLDIASGNEKAGALPPQEVDKLGTHALECVSDLALWAHQLGLDTERDAIENLAIDFALWIAANGGVISVLEPVVNALARRANSSHTPETLTALLHLTHELVAHADPRAGNSLESANPDQPWRILNFNLAIIATRTQKPELMNAAYDLLEQNLPHECAAFYEEGLNQAQKRVYEPQVHEIMQQRLAKWTTRH